MRTLLLAFVLISAARAAQTVEGRVVNSVTGAGIRDVKVRLIPLGDTDSYNTITDEQGRFRIEGVEEGAYTPQYLAPGFGATPDRDRQLAPIAVASGAEPVRVEARLQPFGKISGRVLDGAGRPVPNAGVWLLYEPRWCARCVPLHGGAKANAQGEYEVANLAAGQWLVSAAAPDSWQAPEPRGDEQRGWAQTFYPGTADPELAEAVTVRPGGEAWTLDIKLAAVPVHAVRGRLLDAAGNTVAKSEVKLVKGFGPQLTAVTKDDGTFEFASVTDGEWRLKADLSREGVKLRAAAEVDIKGRDLPGIDVRLAAPFALSGKLVLEAPEGMATSALPEVNLQVRVAGAGLSDIPLGFHPIEITDGSLAVSDLYPGSYAIEPLGTVPPPYYLDSIRLGSRDALGGDVAILSAAEPLTVTYKMGGGTVRGTLEKCDGATLLLIPQEPALQRAGFIRTARCGDKGQFEFAAVRPGEYYAIGIRWMAGVLAHLELLRDPTVLQQATMVTVRGNESTGTAIPVIAR